MDRKEKYSKYREEVNKMKIGKEGRHHKDSSETQEEWEEEYPTRLYEVMKEWNVRYRLKQCYSDNSRDPEERPYIHTRYHIEYYRIKRDNQWYEEREKYTRTLLSEIGEKKIRKSNRNTWEKHMNKRNISWRDKKIYKLGKYSNITTDEVKSESISKEYRIPVKCDNISGENQENEEQYIEMKIEIGSYISSYCECKYIDTEICEDKRYEYRILWRDTEIWDSQF